MVEETINSKLLKILACPVCRREVRLQNDGLVCVNCGRWYPIVDGIPHLLPPELMPPEYKKKKA